MTTKNENKYLRKPDWIRSNLILSEKAGAILKMLKKKGLHTVCQEASCPNKGTCWNNNDITFLVMGPHCTRNCKFCNVESTFPDKLNLNEPSLISDVINQLKSDYSVITSVTRDDLEDYGCSHFVNIIKTIKKNCNTAIELLIPDFKTKKEFLSNIINENPDVIGHNIETVERLYPETRPNTTYDKTLKVIKLLKMNQNKIAVKSSLMVGLGETIQEILTTAQQVKNAGADIFYLGQYLQPSPKHIPVKKYYHPDEFNSLEKKIKKLGFSVVLAGPLVRSSFKAKESYLKYKEEIRRRS
ncbi:MAG: lipoyl synthase [Candidatus Aureabacteria bacterium]|nr:lipoyl synthase [Candidatus Auribacterota bacterium]